MQPATRSSGAAGVATRGEKDDMAIDSNKEKALGLALGSIEKAFGKGAIMRLGDVEQPKDVAVILCGLERVGSGKCCASIRE